MELDKLGDLAVGYYTVVINNTAGSSNPRNYEALLIECGPVRLDIYGNSIPQCICYRACLVDTKYDSLYQIITDGMQASGAIRTCSVDGKSSINYSWAFEQNAPAPLDGLVALVYEAACAIFPKDR